MLLGKDAVDYFNYAHKVRTSGDIIDAYYFMTVANHYMTPGGNFFKFENADHMVEYADTLNYENNAKYLLPYTIEQMKTKPQVFNIHLELVEGKLTPMIVYLSTVYVKDTIALKKENDELNSKIGSIFPGMDKNNKSILYRAYNEKPNGQNSPKYYGFIKQQELYKKD